MDGAGGPARVGIGLRAPHYREILERRPGLDFLEVHSENFFGEGGPALAWLDRIRPHYALSLHGVGASLGSVDPLDPRRIERLRALVRRFEPVFVSEHLCWSSLGGRHANDLLPLPFSGEALAHVVGRIGELQERLGRRILVENVSSYVRLPHAEMPEEAFVAEAVRRSGCGLLLDLNNAWVNSVNHGADPYSWIEAIDPASVAEIHLAGFEPGPGLLVDTHAAPVDPAVWALYEAFVRRHGPRPTLVEWDARLPSLDVLLGEARRAAALMA
jgi:uncharacterized protein (UPF0276 family)